MKHFQNEQACPPVLRFLKIFWTAMRICNTARRHRIRAKIQNVAAGHIEHRPPHRHAFDLCDAAATWKPLRELGCRVFLWWLAALTALHLVRIREPWVGVHIGGDMNVSEAFHVTSEWQLIATW